MIHLAIFLVLVVVGVLLFAKFHNSKAVDKLTHDITCEETDEPKKTDELISDAEQADDALDQRADDNEEKIKRVQTDTKSIDMYLKKNRKGEE